MLTKFIGKDVASLAEDQIERSNHLPQHKQQLFKELQNHYPESGSSPFSLLNQKWNELSDGSNLGLPIKLEHGVIGQINWLKDEYAVAKTSAFNTALSKGEVRDRKSYLKMRLKANLRDIRDEFAFKSDMTELVVRELVEKSILSKQE